MSVLLNIFTIMEFSFFLTWPQDLFLGGEIAIFSPSKFQIKNSFLGY